MPGLDGNGWVSCGCGHRHWGVHGAAGLLLEVGGSVLLQLRPGWAHHGGTWSIPGGARDSHETVVEAALREAHEETHLDGSAVTVDGVHRVQHPDWRYDTVLAHAAAEPAVTAHAESVQLAWVACDRVPELNLHPGLAEAWPSLLLPRRHLVVDVANVVGSRPDGWWKDRPGAAGRLLDELEGVAGRVITWGGSSILCGAVTAVLEASMRRARPRGLTDLVQTVSAPGIGDDTIATLAATLPGALVVTSDRGLRSRVDASVPVSALWDWLRA